MNMLSSRQAKGYIKLEPYKEGSMMLSARQKKIGMGEMDMEMEVPGVDMLAPTDVGGGERPIQLDTLTGETDVIGKIVDHVVEFGVDENNTVKAKEVTKAISAFDKAVGDEVMRRLKQRGLMVEQ